jgi:hypothetical protein
VRSSKPLIVRENCVFWLLSRENCDCIVFLIKTRRTGIDAATIVIAVSAVARIMRLTVATWASPLVCEQ